MGPEGRLRRFPPVQESHLPGAVLPRVMQKWAVSSGVRLYYENSTPESASPGGFTRRVAQKR